MQSSRLKNTVPPEKAGGPRLEGLKCAMFSPRLIAFFALLVASTAEAQTVVNSTFQPNGAAYWGDANNWSPPEVPNNSLEKNYNVTIPGFVRLNVDATISNLALTGSFLAEDHSLTVTGSTTATNFGFSIVSSLPAGATFATGSLSSFSAGSLTGSYYLANYTTTSGWATFQFNGADVITLSNARVVLTGPLTRMVDEFGNDAFRHLAHVESDSSFHMAGRQLILSGPFTNEGELLISAAFNHPGLFSILGALTNFDAASRTLTGGKYYIGASYFAGSNLPAVFQFAGADIVHNAAFVGISGPLARIVDQNGNDALRNFSHNASTGVFSVSERDFSIPGNFTNDGRLILGSGTFTIEGTLTNFDPATRTLTGGAYELYGNPGPVSFIFSGADIVNNAASLHLLRDARISDENGNDALRNFVHNLPGAEFTINDSFSFTAASDFTNAGAVNIAGYEVSPGHFRMAGNHRYLQTQGTTSISDAIFTGRMEINGGSLSAYGNSLFGNPSVINGDVYFGEATLIPQALIVNGSVELSAASRLSRSVVPGLFHPPTFVVDDTFTAAGTLRVTTGKFRVGSSEVAQVVQAGAVVGTFSNAPNGSRVLTVDGRTSFLITYTPTQIFLSDFQANPPAAQLLNISTRAHVQRGNNVVIGGFIISGQHPKKVIIRGLGPSLSDFGMGWVLANPALELHGSGGGTIATNNDWQDSQSTEIQASGLAPSDDLESAIVATLSPGAYTAVLSGETGATGVGLVEVYDLASETKSKIANIGTRALVDADNLLIGGFVVGGSGEADAEVVVRALGPRLSWVGMTGFLPDPTLELRDGHGTLIAFNDDCSDTPENRERIDPSLYLFHAADSALAATLPKGNYTAIVRGKNNASGIALVEVYDMNR